MSRLVVKCPKCEHTESVVSSKPGADLPPCPRCEGNDEFIRMENHTPAPNQQAVAWSTGGSQATTSDGEQAPQASPPGLSPKKKDNRGYGPQPRA